MSETFKYVYRLDALSLIAIALLFAIFVLLPIALWVSFILPLWRVGGLEGWIALGGHQQRSSRRTSSKKSESAVESALLSFKSVHYTVQLPGKKGDLHVLKGVSGVLPPGSLTAIMGPSGCGKSTLLDVLANTKNVGIIEGDVRLNGRPRDGTFRSVCAYVMQEDCCHKTLTVRETLWFTAALRLGPTVSRKERLDRIRDTLVDVDLTHVADTRIGDDVSGGLSGGQRRRVTIAIELISKPALVLLDEPTSGLDAYGAQQVVSSLRRFADRGRTLACTIHQPRAETFALFHQLLLIKAGETMYFGPVSKIPEHFEACGVPCPPSLNPADIVVDLTYTKERGDRDVGDRCVTPDELVRHFKNSKLRRETINRILAIEAGTDPDLPSEMQDDKAGAGGAVPQGDAGYPNSLWTQVGVLMRRQYTIDMRDLGYKFTWFFNGFVFALNAATYLLVAQPPLSAKAAPVYRDALESARVCNLDTDAHDRLVDDAKMCGEALTNLTSVEYAHKGFLFLVINALFINEAVHVPGVLFDKRFFAREHGARAYSAMAWHMSWLIKLMLTAAIKLLVYTPCFYFLGQLRLDFTAYTAAAFVTGGMSFAGSAVALLLACIIPSLGAASTAFGCAVLLYQNVCGFFLPISAIPPYLVWVAWSSVFTYGYYALINSQQLGSAMSGGGDKVEDRQVFTFNVLLFVWGLVFHFFAFLATRAVNSKHAIDLGPNGPHAIDIIKEGEDAPRPGRARWASVRDATVQQHQEDRWSTLLEKVTLVGPPKEKIGRLRNLFIYLHLSAARQKNVGKSRSAWTQG